jgi:hypothetical protein
MSAVSIGAGAHPARLWASIARTLRFRRMEIARRIARLKAEDEKLAHATGPAVRRRAGRIVSAR